MRFAVAALCVLALTGSAEADYVLKGQYRAPCNALPPIAARQRPNVPYVIAKLPQATVQRTCASGVKKFQPITACVHETEAGGHIIYVSDFLSAADYACVLVYEFAHLPPNNWKDQAWEDQAFKGTPYISRQSVPVN